MKKNTFLFWLFTLITFFSANTQAQTYKVNYQQNGFEGYIQFEIVKDSYLFGEPIFKIKNNVTNVITSYQIGNHNAVLSRQGITFPKTLNVSVANNGVNITGKAVFYMNTAKTVTHKSQPEIYLSLYDPFPKAPDFSTEAIDHLKEYGKNHNVSLWKQTGELTNLRVKDVYFNDFRSEVEKVIREAERAQKEQELAEEKKQKEEQARKEQLAKGEADKKASGNSGAQAGTQGSNQSATNQTANKLGVQISDKANTTTSSTTAQEGATTTATAVKSEEQLKKEKAEEDYRKAQEAYRQALLDQQRRNRQIEQGVVGVTQGGSDMVTALSGMAGHGANHIIGVSGDFLGGDGEDDDYNPSLIRGQLFYRFQSDQRFAMIGEFGFGYGGMPAPVGEDYNEFDENPGPGFSLAFGLGYKVYKSKTNKSNVMLGVQGGYSMYFANEVADIGFPVVGFIDLIADKVIYVGFYYGVYYPMGREDTAFGQNRSTPVGGFRVGFPF